MDRRIPLGLKVGAAVAALIVGSIGLAYAAGVELPGRASDKASEATASVEKPERDEGDTDSKASQGGKSVSDAVHEVIEDRDGGGCDFGQAVAEAARANSQGEDAGAEDPCDHDPAQADAGRSEDKDKPGKNHEPNGNRDTGDDHAADRDDDDELEDASDDSEHVKDGREEDSHGAGGSGEGRGDHGPHDDEDDDEDEDHGENEDELEDE